MAGNRRIFYACQQVCIGPDGTSSFTSTHLAHGVQSVGINTRFNLEQVFEIGQLAIYENIENLPDIEVTAEKVLDGYALLYHLATPTAVSPSLAGRSVDKCIGVLSIFEDTKDSASGSPISEIECSGLFISNLSYTFPVEGNCTESVTFVGNNKVCRTSGFKTTGLFPANNDAPIGSGGVQRRENVIFGTTGCILPTSVQGITSLGAGSGYNAFVSGEYGAHITQISASTNLGRENLNELGRKGPYHRFVTFPTEVTCDIEVISTKGDLVNALESQDNLVDEKIYIKTQDGTILDLGTRNKLNSVSYGGGNAGTGGGNVTVTYSYRNFNDLIVKQPSDPAGLYP